MRPTPEAAVRHDAAPPAGEAGARARRLRERLAALPVAIVSASCVQHDVVVPSYADGPRPSSTVLLSGRGSEGRGEHVGWTRAAHDACAVRVATLALAGCGTVGDVARHAAQALDDVYDRAALEAAAIDLALAQAGSNPFRLIDAAPQPLRYVVSFERVADPLARAATELRHAPGVELKIDVDPAWDDATFVALAALGRVAVLDFKLSGTVAEHERAHRLVPAALLEDPLPGATRWSAALRSRLSLDAAVRSTVALGEIGAADRPAAVNVKPARIGSVLEALDVVVACAARGIDVYFGGMFELGVGRAQLQTLAALLCPDAPNDVAPIARADDHAVRPPRLLLRDAGTGFAAGATDGALARQSL